MASDHRKRCIPLDSLYAKYLKERTDDLIYESLVGFATYRYLPDQNAVYIVDIFVLPDYRKDGHATVMADKIVLEAKQKGCTKIIGSVVPSKKNSTISLKVLLGYGMKLEQASDDFIVFSKEI